MSTTSRERFEAWAKGFGADLLGDEDEYDSASTDTAWWAWQAAEEGLAPAVRLAEAYEAWECLPFGKDREESDQMKAALDAYRATKAHPARDPLVEIASLLGQVHPGRVGDHERLERAKALCAEAIRRAK